jgi:hypothetical protein
MAKSKATAVKTPAKPRHVMQWQLGDWAGSTPNKVQYYYCKKVSESLDSIAKSLSGKSTGNVKLPSFKAAMTWQDIAQLNFGTVVPGEINWYLETFCGCGELLSSDKTNYCLCEKDDRPWLWLPTEPGKVGGATGAPHLFFVKSPVSIFSEDGVTMPPRLIYKNDTIKLKAVPASGKSGTFTWTSLSPYLHLTNATSATVSVRADNVIGDPFKPDRIAVQFTESNGTKWPKVAITLSIVEMFFSKAAAHLWGFDDMGAPGVANHVSVRKNTKTPVTVVIRGVSTEGLDQLDAGSEFTFASSDASIANVTLPVGRPVTFDITVEGKNVDKAECSITVKANASGAVVTSFKVNVYKELLLEATIAKVYDSTSPASALSFPNFDAEAAGRAITPWYRQAVASIKLKDHSPTKGAIDVRYDAAQKGVLILEPGVVSPGEQAIMNAFTASGQRVVIVKDLCWYYYLDSNAPAGATNVTLKGSYYNANPDLSMMTFWLTGETYALGEGANEENVTVQSVTGSTVEFTAPLVNAHTTAEALKFPLGGLSGNPIFVIEKDATVNLIRAIIAHECGHSLLNYHDLEFSSAIMHYQAGETHKAIYFRDLPKKYPPLGNENQWEIPPR